MSNQKNQILRMKPPKEQIDEANRILNSALIQMRPIYPYKNRAEKEAQAKKATAETLQLKQAPSTEQEEEISQKPEKKQATIADVKAEAKALLQAPSALKRSVLKTKALAAIGSNIDFEQQNIRRAEIELYDNVATYKEAKTDATKQKEAREAFTSSIAEIFLGNDGRQQEFIDRFEALIKAQ
jgi:hypothetical protein